MLVYHPKLTCTRPYKVNDRGTNCFLHSLTNKELNCVVLFSVIIYSLKDGNKFTSLSITMLHQLVLKSTISNKIMTFMPR